MTEMIVSDEFRQRVEMYVDMCQYQGGLITLGLVRGADRPSAEKRVPLYAAKVEFITGGVYTAWLEPGEMWFGLASIRAKRGF